MYIYFEASHCEKLKVTIDGKTETYSDKRGHIVHLGQCDAGKVVTLDFPMDSEYETGNVKLQMYALNQDIFDSANAQLADEQLPGDKLRQHPRQRTYSGESGWYDAAVDSL